MAPRRPHACADTGTPRHAPMPEVFRLRVLYADTDAMGVVWHGTYLRWFERARTELMRGTGMPYTALIARGLNLPVVEALVRYRRPARFDDELSLRAAARAGGVRLRIDYRIERDGELIAEGHTEHAFTDADGRVRRPPPDVQEVLARLAAREGGG